MKTNKTIKQITITQQDIVDVVIDELYNLGYLEKTDNEVNLYESVTFEHIQCHCNKDIKEVLKGFKTGIDEMELEEFEFWFGFNTQGFLREINKNQ